MTKIDMGKLWKPVQKSGHFKAEYVRTARVARSSDKVRAVNAALSAAAKGCKGGKTSDGSFQACISKQMKGFKA